MEAERVFEPERMEDTKKNTALQINMIKIYINSQRLKQHTQGLHGAVPGPLCTHVSFQFRIFSDSRVCK